MALPAENLLRHETSPYLLQHADNPVHWRPWGPEALAEAQELGKPILLSVGYAACHWCHVMAHESFEDPETAALMNRLFVNIKVDREERPEVDQIYMNALHALGEQGGWPLTMFLTSDGGPVWGGTYFPKEPRFGRPSFKQVLEAVARIFRDEPRKAAQNREALLQALRQTPDKGRANLGRQLLNTAAERLFTVMDPVHGGTQGAPKFPQAGLLELFWRAGKRMREPRYIDMVLLTLARDAYAGALSNLTEGDRFAHAARAGRRTFPGLATDYANMVKAALALFEATDESRYLDDAKRWTAALDAHHWNEERGGYYLSADDAAALILRPWNAADEATPNANGIMAENLSRLWLLTGEEAYGARADAIFDAFAGEAAQNVFAHASLLNAFDTRLEAVQIVLAAPPGADLDAWRRAANMPLPNRVLQSAGTDLPPSHPAHGKGPVNGAPAAYVCIGTRCSLPLTSPEALRAFLAQGAPMSSL